MTSWFHGGLSTSGLRLAHLALLMILPPLPMTWARVGDLAVKAGAKNANFAILIAREGVRVNADNLSWMEGRLDDCRLTKVQRAKLSETQVHNVRLFATNMCKPWSDWWERSLIPCSEGKSPAWCRDQAAYLERLNPAGYFGAMTASLRLNSHSLERYNLMYIMSSALTAQVMSELPEEQIDGWFREALPVYLETASPDEVILMGELFQTTWVGVLPGVAEAFTAYAEGHEGITETQRAALLEIAGERFEE
jgi:hypothetical protein